MKKECKRHGLQTYIQNGVNPKTGTPKFRCPQCSKEWVNKYKNDQKQKLVERAGGKCQRCGYNRCMGALHFHHKDPSQKDFELGKRHVGLNWDDLIKEVDKCELLCANCHAEAHSGLF